MNETASMLDQSGPIPLRYLLQSSNRFSEKSTQMGKYRIQTFAQMNICPAQDEQDLFDRQRSFINESISISLS